MELSNAINWFEIPVTDFGRAKTFYEQIFSYQMPETVMDETRMGFFLYDAKAGKVGGAIICNKDFEPAAHGTLVYLNCQPNLQIVLDKVEAAGGTILQQKKKISEQQELGYWAMMLDTEGNKVALHSMG